MLASPRESCAENALGQISWWSSVGQSLVEFGLNVTNGAVIRKMGNTLFDGPGSAQGDDHTKKKVTIGVGWRSVWFFLRRSVVCGVCVCDGRKYDHFFLSKMQVCTSMEEALAVCL